MDDRELGRRLQAARKAKGMTQAQVSALAGLGANVLSEYERGASGISDERLVQLAQLYGVEASELAGRPLRTDRPDAFYDGVLHSLAVFNKASAQLIAEIQQWRSEARRHVTSSGAEPRRADQDNPVPLAQLTTAVEEVLRRIVSEATVRNVANE